MSNQNLVPYVFGDEMVRVRQDENGDPWFAVKDVCRVLSLSNVTEATRNLEDDERGSVILNTLGGEQEMLTVSESGIYALIFRSRKPQAKAFRKWVTSEVLPAIRKTGRYEAPRPEAHTAQEERVLGTDEQVADLKELARNVPLRGTFRVQVLQLAERMARSEGVSGEAEVLSRYLSLCETVCSQPRVVTNTEDEARVGQFVEECCDNTDEDAAVKSADLYQAYCAWCADKGYRARSGLWFGKQIGRYFERYKSNTVHYRGARLLN